MMTLEEQNKELKIKLEEEIAVKKCEVMLNKDLKCQIETQKLYIDTLNQIIDNYAKKIGKLRNQLKDQVEE
jgi:uncharacterized coiled-coil protein SlyX